LKIRISKSPKNEEELVNNFHRFCKQIFQKNKLQILRIFFEEWSLEMLSFLQTIRKTDFPVLNTLFYYLNETQIPEFSICIRLNTLHKINPNNLTKIINQADTLVLIEKNGFLTIDTLLRKKSKRRMMFVVDPEVEINLDFLSHKHNSFESLCVDISIFPNKIFPEKIGDPKDIKNLEITFPKPPSKNDLISFDNIINMLSNNDSLQSLVLSFHRLDKPVLEKLNILRTLPCVHSLTNYSICLSKLPESKIPQEIFKEFLDNIASFKKLESLNLNIEKKIENVGILWELPKDLPELKNLSIHLRSYNEWVELKVLFENLAKMEKIEKLELWIPDNNYHRLQILNSFVRLRNLRELKIEVTGSLGIGDEIKFSDYEEAINLKENEERFSWKNCILF